MLKINLENFINLPKNNERKKEESLCFLESPEESERGKNNKPLLFQDSSGKIFVNSIIHSIISFSEKMKRIARKIKRIVFRKSRDFLKSFKDADLWKYIPIKVFILSLSSGALTFSMVYAGTFSKPSDSLERNLKANTISEDMNNKIIIKNIGKLDDRQLAEISSKDCDFNYQNSLNSELCGVDVKNNILINAERKEEQARLAAARARAVASRVSTGKISCREKNLGHPQKSDTKGKHVDEDCCPDPDEWPKPGCIYNAEGYSIMLKGPAKKK